MRYRSALIHGQKLEAAISGLGQNGANADAPLIQPLLNSPASRVRKAAVTALGRLLGDSAVGRLDLVFTTPTAEQRQQLETLLDDRTLSLPQGLAARLQEWLKYR